MAVLYRETGSAFYSCRSPPSVSPDFAFAPLGGGFGRLRAVAFLVDLAVSGAPFTGHVAVADIEKTLAESGGLDWSAIDLLPFADFSQCRTDLTRTHEMKIDVLESCGPNAIYPPKAFALAICKRSH